MQSRITGGGVVVGSIAKERFVSRRGVTATARVAIERVQAGRGVGAAVDIT